MWLAPPTRGSMPTLPLRGDVGMPPIVGEELNPALPLGASKDDFNRPSIIPVDGEFRGAGLVEGGGLAGGFEDGHPEVPVRVDLVAEANC